MNCRYFGCFLTFSLFVCVHGTHSFVAQKEEKKDSDEWNEWFLELMHSALRNGFQKVIARGPLCGEAMDGVGFVVDGLSVEEGDGV